jgi:hypothetical protein
MAVIRVPKPPKSAYNPRRPAGTLLQNQVTHLEWAVRPAGARKPAVFQVKPPKTEREAAARIQKLTVKLEQQARADKVRRARHAKAKHAARRTSTRKRRAATRKKSR